jgi:hypothetical protein
MGPYTLAFNMQHNPTQQTVCISIAILISSSGSGQHVTEVIIFTAWYTPQESCCSYTVTRALALKWRSHLTESCFLHFTAVLFLRNSVYMLGNFHRLLWQCKHMPECRMTQNKEQIRFPKRSDWLRDPHRFKYAPVFFPEGKAF